MVLNKLIKDTIQQFDLNVLDYINNLGVVSQSAQINFKFNYKL